jgi:glycosyltransferase involved in cell wall biosynthesis
VSDVPARRRRVAIVASHVIQYQDPFFRLLAQEPDLDVTVLFCSMYGAVPYRDEDMKTTLQWDLPMLQGYAYRSLRNLAHDPNAGFTRAINPGIVPALIGGRYDAVIFMIGWGTVTSLLGMLACRAARIPFFLFGDSSYPPPVDSARAAIRAGFLRALFGLTTGFLVSGLTNAKYYQHYGADPKRFFLMPWAIDNDRFFAACRAGTAERGALRERLGIGADRMVAVFSGKLIERKDPRTLVRAVSRMPARDRVTVLFLGDGVLREALEQQARAEGVHAVFPGFINQADLPKYYAAADVFVLGSTYEPRGTVINEAMACSLPLVVSDRMGAIGDLVLDGENAFVFPAGDTDALAHALQRLADDPELRERMGARSRAIIGEWDFARGVRGVKQALHWLERQELV